MLPEYLLSFFLGASDSLTDALLLAVLVGGAVILDFPATLVPLIDGALPTGL